MKPDIKKLSIPVFCLYLTAVALICFLKPSSLPEVDIKTFLGLPIDKCLHFLMFLPYPVLASMVFMRDSNGFFINIVTLVILMMVGTGISYGTELIQAQTGYRSYEIADFYADVIGIATGSVAVAAYLIHTRLKT